MLRRVLSLIACAVLTGAALFATTGPAHADIVDVTQGPLSIGGYCQAKINSSAWIGFYESSGLRCYASGTSGNPGLQFVGNGDPYLACKHLTLDVIMAAFRGPSDSLVCRAIR